ncbi:histidine phosphatase family protein [uncultured Vagococcus sp.]|uniref:histidine phosphatase family protein n=1 Tax=uncultured Vagococcus sp. TaxID=189676 RepID=UPI0028D462A6|nr:histidine phosphatase family protein [uncultured Vagococcus sp.]
MTTFYCVRHGKTEFNLNKTFQGGGIDSPLLAEGRTGATLVGNHLKAVPFKKVFVSPQKRAQDTAQLILDQHNHPPKLETIEDLREMGFGSWDGQPEINYHHDAEFQHLVHRPHLYNPSHFGGETFAAMIQRGKLIFQKIAKEHPEDDVLIVSHGLFLQTLLKDLQGTPLSEIRQGSFLDNTSVTTVISSNEGQTLTIDTWNDTSFIP